MLSVISNVEGSGNGTSGLGCDEMFPLATWFFISIKNFKPIRTQLLLCQLIGLEKNVLSHSLAVDQ